MRSSTVVRSTMTRTMNNETSDGANDESSSNTIPSASEPSLENPSWDYLFNNFTKLELQKQCRAMGITKIWVTKDKLVDLIMRAHPSTHNERNEETCDPIQKLQDELHDLREKIEKKDFQIEELSKMIQSAYVTINRLNDRVSTLEERSVSEPRNATAASQEMSESPLSTSPPQPPPEKTLLIGDSNLRHVRMSDLGKDCAIRTIPGASADILRCWVNEMLEWTPTRCILYCGIHELIDNVSPDLILDDIASLILDLKKKNETMGIYVCELVPPVSLDELTDRVKQFNDKLKEWSNKNGIPMIQTHLSFSLGTGEIDEMCFLSESDDEGIFLNRYGVLRLLSVMSKQCSYFTLAQNGHKLIIREHERYNTGRNDRQMNNRINRYNRFDNRENTSRGQVHRPNNNRHSESNRDVYSRTSTHFSMKNRLREGNLRQGCFNCGEFNHRQSTCRFDHKIKCTSCHMYGHKSKLCNHYCHE